MTTGVEKDRWLALLADAVADGKDVWCGGEKVAACWTAEWAQVIADALHSMGESIGSRTKPRRCDAMYGGGRCAKQSGHIDPHALTPGDII